MQAVKSVPFLENNTDAELEAMITRVEGYLNHPAGLTMLQITDCLTFHHVVRKELRRRQSESRRDAIPLVVARALIWPADVSGQAPEVGRGDPPQDEVRAVDTGL
jgi:hypothetical protein